MTSSNTEKKVHVVGAGGHSRSVICLLENNHFIVEGVYDPSYKKGSEELILGHPLAGAEPDGSLKMILALGDNAKRMRVFEARKAGIFQPLITHPSAVIERSSSFGKGDLVFAGAVVSAAAQVGDDCILNTRCVIEHECMIGDHSHISVGAILCGRVKIGTGCFIGAGAVVIDTISICDWVTVGANAVVINDITEPGVYIGNPARKIK
jgi:UDP-N-acetylbacillosamine N-acetyltransferase